MEALLAKLTNLSYEFFGILLPGVITLIFLVLWWVCLGQLAPLLSNNFFPQLTSTNAATVVESVSVKTGVGIAAPALLLAYFLGHILHWIARSGKADDGMVKNALKRTGMSLLFRLPKPAQSYDPSLQPLLEAVHSKFFAAGGTPAWTHFFPVVKSYLSRNLAQSLVALYQNKYTLHRSIAAAAAVVFWLSLLSLATGMVTVHISGIAPRWVLLSLLDVGAIILVWGFSASYAYHWKLFGNTVITESFSLINGPALEAPHAKP